MSSFWIFLDEHFVTWREWTPFKELSLQNSIKWFWILWIVFKRLRVSAYESEKVKVLVTLCGLMDCIPQALLPVGFSRREYWGGQSFPSPGDLPNPGIESGSPALQADSLLSERCLSILVTFVNLGENISFPLILKRKPEFQKDKSHCSKY